MVRRTGHIDFTVDTTIYSTKEAAFKEIDAIQKVYGGIIIGVWVTKKSGNLATHINVRLELG